MARFNVEKARAAGMSEERIAQYLSSAQAQSDSQAVAPSQASPANPVGGALGAAGGLLESIGGPRTLLYAGGLGGAAALGKKFFGKGAPTTQAPMPMENPRANPKLVALTPQDIKANPAFKRFQPGQEISRTAYEKSMMAPDANGKIVPIRSKTPTRPITVAGKPAAAPAQTENPRYTGGRGASKPELARRAAMLRGEPVPGTVAAAEAAPDQALWRSRGLSVPRGQAAEFGPPALELLLMLLNASHAGQDMDAAHQYFEQQRLQGMEPSTRRAMSPSPGI